LPNLKKVGNLAGSPIGLLTQNLCWSNFEKLLHLLASIQSLASFDFCNKSGFGNKTVTLEAVDHLWCERSYRDENS
jgi:hypothetical protein